MVNGAAAAVVAAGGGVGAIQPKLSVSIHKRRKRRRHQLNRIRSEFLVDSSSVRMSGSGNLMLMANHQYSGISPTLSSSSSSSSASTSSLESSTGSPSCVVGQQQVTGVEFPSFRTATSQVQAQVQPQQHQWYPGCYAGGLNINNNYLIPTPVYDVPNEVIDDGAPQQQYPHHHHHHPQQQPDEESQEVMLYDGNNNPLSSWEEFILTTNKSGPGEHTYLMPPQLTRAQLTPSSPSPFLGSPSAAPPDRGDILICGNCRELFNDLEQLLEHRKTTCQLRVFCECRNTASNRKSNDTFFHPPSFVFG